MFQIEATYPVINTVPTVIFDVVEGFKGREGVLSCTLDYETTAADGLQIPKGSGDTEFGRQHILVLIYICRFKSFQLYHQDNYEMIVIIHSIYISSLLAAVNVKPLCGSKPSPSKTLKSLSPPKLRSTKLTF